MPKLLLTSFQTCERSEALGIDFHQGQFEAERSNLLKLSIFLLQENDRLE